MSATFEFFYAGIYRLGGVAKNVYKSTMRAPAGSRTTTGTQSQPAQIFRIVPGTSKVLYRHSGTTPQFDNIVLRILEGNEVGLADDAVNGFGWLHWLIDKSSGDSNDSPAGTRESWQNKGLSCHGLPEIFNTKYALVDTTLSLLHGDDAGDPLLADSATREQGRIYEIRLENPDEDLDLYVEVGLVN